MSENMANILIVDDMRMNLRLLQHILQDAGHQTTEYDSAVLALHEWPVKETEDEYDIVLSDINMPEMNGIQFFQELTQRGVKSTLIGMTANAYGYEQYQMREAGARMIVPKPYNVDGLLRAIEEASKHPLPNDEVFKSLESRVSYSTQDLYR